MTQQAKDLAKTVERGVIKISTRAGMNIIGKFGFEDWEKASNTATAESGPGYSVYFIPNGE
jgi:hypothetical protein